jgi:exosortase C (VPDSG-CTERM-specific)
MSPFRRLAWVAFILAVLFSPTLYALVQLSMRSNLHSHVVLIPFICMYLAWLKRHDIAANSVPGWGLTAALSAAGITLVGTYAIMIAWGWKPIAHNGLSLMTAAFLVFFWSGCAWSLGLRNFRTLVFPIGFLVFMIPLPTIAEAQLEGFLQHGSAEASYWLLKLAGTPVFRDGTHFKLPTITLAVAPECSGLRSSLVLFMTALLAGHFFLRKIWTQTILAISIILLGIARNAVRIFVIAQLCVHVDPGFIDSPIHHRGGPVFFAASLIPFFVLVWLLRRIERKRGDPPTALPLSEGSKIVPVSPQ